MFNGLFFFFLVPIPKSTLTSSLLTSIPRQHWKLFTSLQYQEGEKALYLTMTS